MKDNISNNFFRTCITVEKTCKKMIQQIFLFQLYLSFSILNSILSIILDM